jgi:RNA polymerase sigma factor for flagellar operon FliA
MDADLKVDPKWEFLIEKNLGLAYSAALKVYKTAPHALDLEELRSIALLALVEVCARWPQYCEEREFDPMNTKYFPTVAARRTKGAIIDYLRKVDHATRSMRERSRKINQILNSSSEDYNYSQLAELTGLTEKEVRDTFIGLSRAPISLDVAMQGLDTESGEQSGLQLAEDRNTESSAAVNFMLASFADAVRDLAYENRLIIVLHYYSGFDLKKIAAMLSMADSDVIERHSRAVAVLLKILESSAS